MSTISRGAGYFHRSYVEDLQQVNTRIRRVGLAGLVLILLLLPTLVSGQYVDLSAQAAIAVIGALALNILTGCAGQLSLGHAALLGVGGFATGIAATEVGVPWPLDIAVAMVAGGVVGLVLGLPALRLRGLYLVLATVAAHFIAVYAFSHYQSSRRGIVGLTGMTLDRPQIGSFVFDTPTRWYYLLVAVAAVVAVYSVNVLRTRPGRAWTAVRDRDLVASALGIDVVRYKLTAFVLSSMLAALAGSLLVYYNGSVSAETFTLNLAITYLVMVIVGGLGSTAGAIIGAIFVTMSLRLLTFALEAVNTSSRFQADYLIPLQVILFGVLTVGFLIFEPRGLIGIWNRVRTYFELWPFTRRPLAERRR